MKYDPRVWHTNFKFLEPPFQKYFTETCLQVLGMVNDLDLYYLCVCHSYIRFKEISRDNQTFYTKNQINV